MSMDGIFSRNGEWTHLCGGASLLHCLNTESLELLHADIRKIKYPTTHFSLHYLNLHRKVLSFIWTSSITFMKVTVWPRHSIRKGDFVAFPRYALIFATKQSFVLKWRSAHKIRVSVHFMQA